MKGGRLDDRERVVSEGWGAWAASRDGEVMQRVAWMEFPPCTAYINRLISGDECLGWLEHLSLLFETPFELGLSICCGAGHAERRAIDLGMAKEMEGVDLSGDALEIARATAAWRPITYRTFDANEDELPADRYDLVICGAALHHVTNLEHCLVQIHGSLKEGGMLLLNEFVGPDRFQWTDKQLEAINDLFEPLPERYKHNILSGRTHATIERRPLAYMIEADPSEAVRSSEIVELVTRLFEPVATMEFGGTILHPMLEGVTGNFDEDDEADRAVVRSLIEAEERLVGGGTLPSDFLVMAARKRSFAAGDRERLVAQGGEKSAIIVRQENEILELTRRLEEAERRNRELSQVCDGHRLEAEELRRERETLIGENRELKSRGGLGAARYLYRRLKRTPRD